MNPFIAWSNLLAVRIACLTTVLVQSLQAQELIRIDQMGYRPGDEKVAFVQVSSAATFDLVNTTTNASVFKGAVSRIGRRDASSGDYLFMLDFSGVRTVGRYHLRLSNSTVISPEFMIAPDAYYSGMLAALQSFYYHRCGSEVDIGTVWHHPICHTSDAPFYRNTSVTKDVTGGWHDAGDYNKYVPTTAVSAAFLLYLYELRPLLLSDGRLKIPESSNGIPDILDEARWALEWLMKMQRDDGGVFHKVSIKKWTAEHLPQNETDTRHIFEVSSTATAATAAVTALGARLFRKSDPPFARRLMKTALACWGFLELHKTIVPPGGFKNPPDVEGGEYGDDNDADERLWASAELYRLTDAKQYHNYFLSHFEQLGGPNYTVSWSNTANFGYYAYLKTSAAESQTRGRLLTRVRAYADHLLRRVGDAGYRGVLTPDEYYWGSNSVALGYAFDFIMAFEALGQECYRQAALDQIHYILGRNTFGISFVTGVGSHPVTHPYHQFSMMLHAGAPVPGMVAGGPNKNGRLNGKILSGFPAKCYEDNEKNYFVNETAINYTAPFVFVAGYLSQIPPPQPSVRSKARNEGRRIVR